MSNDELNRVEINQITKQSSANTQSAAGFGFRANAAARKTSYPMNVNRSSSLHERKFNLASDILRG